MNTASIHKESKLLYISAIRFVAMIMIIACHICQYFDSQWAWWLNVGVQIFLVLSGFLYGSKDIKEPIKWLKRNINKILLPYYIFILISISLYYIFAPNLISPKRIIEALFCVGTIQGIENLWFVGYILFCYLLTPYLAILTKYLKDKSKKHNIIVLLLFFLIFFIISDLIDFYFKPDKILCYFIGYFVAFFTKNYGDNIINWIFIISCPLAIILKITYLD